MYLLSCRIMEPLLHGDYPISMKKNAGARIPTFTSRESELVKGSSDFIGIIHYSNYNVTDNSDALKTELRNFAADTAAKLVCMYFIDRSYIRLLYYNCIHPLFFRYQYEILN